MLFCSISCHRSAVHHSLKHRYASRSRPFRSTTSLRLQSEDRKAQARNLSYAPIPIAGRRFTIAPICHDTRDKRATVIGSYLKIIKFEVVPQCDIFRGKPVVRTIKLAGCKLYVGPTLIYWKPTLNIHQRQLDGICRHNIIGCSCPTTSNM